MLSQTPKPRRRIGYSNKIDLNSPRALSPASPTFRSRSPNTLRVEDIVPTFSGSPVMPTKKGKTVDLPFEIKGSDFANISTMRSSAGSPLIGRASADTTAPNSVNVSFSNFGSKIQKKLLELREEFEGFTLQESKESKLEVRIPAAFKLDDSKGVKMAIPIEENSKDPYELNLISSIPQLRYCAFCRAEVASEIEYVNDSKTFWSAVGIFALGGVFGCFMIPYMMNSCKGRKLRCRKCKR
mmetsp:Transcript_28834/g.28518  ORF Transcript_28834/g.28518 Transcript_28834/m.28518 type:complete len:240 (-) Transcript_28834:18-737(-)